MVDKNVVHRATHDANTLPCPPTRQSSIDKMDTLAGLARWQQVAHTADNGLDALAELHARRCNCMLGDVCMCACADGERVPRARPSPARVLVKPGPRRDRDDETGRFSVAEKPGDNSRQERCRSGSMPCPFRPRRVRRVHPASKQPKRGLRASRRCGCEKGLGA